MGKTMDVMGVFLIAEEGINATVAARGKQLGLFSAEIQKDNCFTELDIKYATTNVQPLLPNGESEKRKKSYRWV